MTDTENEAVAKELGKGLPDHERPVFWGAALHDRQADEVARAARVALDAHRASQAQVITTVDELEALPVGTRIAIDGGDDVLTKCGDGEWRGGPYATKDGTAWIGLPDEPATFPATVLTTATFAVGDSSRDVGAEEVARTFMAAYHEQDIFDEFTDSAQENSKRAGAAVLALFDRAASAKGGGTSDA